MFWKLSSAAVGLVLLGVCCSADPLRLYEFNEQFATLSADSTLLVQGKWRENGQLNGLLNKDVVILFGEMMYQMRKANEEANRELQGASEIDDNCRMFLEWYFGLAKVMQNYEIQICATYSYSDLLADTANRFRPRAMSLKKMNTRVLHEVVKNLGYNGSLDIESSLEMELKEYKEQLDLQTVLLQDELDEHDEVRYYIVEDMEDCKYWNVRYQSDDIQFIKDNIESNCDYINELK